MIKEIINVWWWRDHFSESVSTDPLGELEVLWHDSHSLGMDSAQVGVLKQRNQVGLSCFLEGKHCLTLESDFLFELGGDLSHQSLEGKFSDEQVGLNKQRKDKRASTEAVERWITSYALLEFSDLSESNCSRFESVGFLDTRDNGGWLSGDFLGSQLFSGHLLGCGLPCGLLGTGHLQ